MRELPLLDEALCTGCGDCAAVCPTACLEMAGLLTLPSPPAEGGEGRVRGQPWMPRPADCVSCALCCLVCPVDALRMAVPASA